MTDFTRKLVGFDNFKRHNPFSDKFEIQRFEHLEFWTTVTKLKRKLFKSNTSNCVLY